MGKTLFDKLWDQHVLAGEEGEAQLLYVDLHLIHEVTSPQGFESLRLAGRPLRAPEKTLATIDHNVPTKDIFNIRDLIAEKQIETLQKNCQDFGVELLDNGDDYQGIVHMIGPEQGITQPGKTIVCGDSHTASHGAFGTIAFGIGSSEVEHVFATQCIWQKKPKNLGVKVTGQLQPGVYSKDIILHLISEYGTDFGTGYALEFFGPTIEDLSMEARITLCNMAIEFGAKFGVIRPDEKTIDYLKDRPHSPKNWDEAVEYWKTLKSDENAHYDELLEIDVTDLSPYVTWGTTPAMGLPYEASFPNVRDHSDERAYEYMDLKPGMTFDEIPLSYVFIGSCTNSRIEDLIEGAKYLKGRKVAPHIDAYIVPGSRQVKLQAEEMGLAQQYIDAGFKWREPGCSSCIAMNGDIIPPKKHCASTTNRNFEGRQGPESRTHLCSPAMAVLAAVKGHFYDTRRDDQEVAPDGTIYSA
ncbi:3-isopropylmalate dehydratase large subunit [Dolosicoccus paucivorans]|uniref:3-isopropylmalate dehydratase large subunit n=1 Tax=Dolosicoccus paucivorans TaxID=84521 RepID=UPI000888CAC3|nr:3-isopropylmalate dehydratase large subunit [Dolosicoccus paucivorans]PMB84101.1 3-isopropylmalate dehydratase large subunit [Dolosicoccus paucivorans]SDI32883.1 3-isopropylmalate dehydratase, large subunit [Dolosicoccus paucivorans]